MKYENENTKEIVFPLGGIGSGCIGLAGNGSLVDWEIFNKPSKGTVNAHSFFAIKAITNGKHVEKVLQGDWQKDFIGQYGKNYGRGLLVERMCGFPHFRNVSFDGSFPIASLRFADSDFPGEVKMTAFNPFIPGDADASSIPAAFFEIEVNNVSNQDVEYQIVLSCANPFSATKNEHKLENNINAIKFYHAKANITDFDYGDLTIATDSPDSFVQTYWYRGTWQDGLVTFWNDFSNTSVLPDRNYDADSVGDTGSIGVTLYTLPNEQKKVRFVISWSVPNMYNYWDEYKDENGCNIGWKNYYATLFEDSFATAQYSLAHFTNLYQRTLKFKEILHGSSFPSSVIDAISSNLSVLKSSTVLRLEDGSFYGWEGALEGFGSCEGTCQHVWNYAYALCFLFPSLERSIRENEFAYSTDNYGKMAFRMLLPLGRGIGSFRACLDGQMGSVIKTYREWKLCGDNNWLAKQWNSVKKILEYAWNEENPDAWDRNKDGVLEGRQHHTLDMELFGPSSWLEGMYLVALKAAAEMAEFLGDLDKAREFQDLFQKGQTWTKKHLFNGKYFIQQIDLADKSITDKFEASQYYYNYEAKQIKYQIANGSSIDQLLAQWHADILGLGDIFDPEQIQSALDEMMRLNFKPNMRNFVNPWRVFCLDDEAGTVICAYPNDEDKPKIPIPYCEETMTGFEYAFAGLLFSRGKLQNGERVVEAVRNRFDGKKRNPFNEFELGSNYARSMASYALVPILSGFRFDLPHSHIGFAPYKQNFRSIWSVDGAWGEFVCCKMSVVLKIVEGEVTLESFYVKNLTNVESVSIDGQFIDFSLKNEKISFAKTKICNELKITSNISIWNK